MRFIQPSPIWTVTKRLCSLRFLIACGLILLSMEVVARIAPYLIGKQVHQRFLYSEYEWQDGSNKGKMLTWMANERGARGNLYHGQAVEIALFGSSTSEDAGLDQQQSWAQQFEMKLSPGLVHVDNYSSFRLVLASIHSRR